MKMNGGEHEAELENIKNTFMSILRDIQKNMELNTSSTKAITAEQLEQLKSALPDKSIADISADDIAGVVTNMLGQALPMDDEATYAIQTYMTNILAIFNDKSNQK